MGVMPLVYVLSAVAITLGAIFLVSTLSAPSFDIAVFVRDLVTSILAIVLGVVAPLLIRKFRSE